MWLGTRLFGSTSGLRNVVVDLMLTVGTHNLEMIGKPLHGRMQKVEYT